MTSRNDRDGSKSIESARNKGFEVFSNAEAVQKADVIMIALPVQSAWWLTLLLGATFVVTGVFRLIMAFQMKATGASIWVGLSGAVSILLGVLIYSIVDLPDPAAFSTAEGAATWFSAWGWVIGLFVALEFLMNGIALVMLALAARSVRQDGGAGRAS